MDPRLPRLARPNVLAAQQDPHVAERAAAPRQCGSYRGRVAPCCGGLLGHVDAVSVGAAIGLEGSVAADAETLRKDGEEAGDGSAVLRTPYSQRCCLRI
jgi:hypothetical protein